MAIFNALQHSLDAELTEDETILWQGQPDPMRSMRSALPIFLFAIPWTLFALTFLPHWRSFPLAANAIPVSFVLIGIGMLYSPILIYNKAKSTVYGITNRRIIIITGNRTKSIQSFYAVDIRGLQRTELVNGTGDVQISNRTSGSGSDATTVPVTLTGIPNPREVEALIRSQFLASNAEQSGHN